MMLKSKLRLALELCLITSALPLLLLGCGGGGSGPNTNGMMSGQFWTDVTGSGVRRFWYGYAATASSPSYPATAYINTATYVGGRYAMTGLTKTMSGVAWTTHPETSYYLVSGGWTIFPGTLSLTASNATTFSYADIGLGNTSASISTINLSGTPVVANIAVPAVDHQGNASAVLPASATYPAGSYAYVITGTSTTTVPGYMVYAEPYNEVTTLASSSLPITSANFNASGFALHASTTDPICVGGYALALSSGNIYNFYGLTLNPGVPAGSFPTCKNATITNTMPVGSYVLTFAPVMGTTVLTFSTPIGVFLTSNTFGNYVVGVIPALNKAYFGDITPAGTSTNTAYWLNKAAMDEAMTAWGVPTF